MNFNEKLIELRKSKHLSQEELGHEIGVSRQTVSKWESGQSYPDFQRLVLLSDYYGLTLDELVHDLDVQDVRDKLFDYGLVHGISRKASRPFLCGAAVVLLLIWVGILIFWLYQIGNTPI